MATKFLNVLPIIKNTYRKTLRATMVAGLVFSSTFGIYNAGREVYEEIKTDNIIVDFDMGFGSFVLFNRDARSAMQVFNDAKQAALNVDGLEDAYLNSNDWSIEKKKEFLEKFAKAIAESAGVRIKAVEFVDKEKIDGARGMYRGASTKNLTFTSNKIFIAKELLDLYTIQEAIGVSYHEMKHFVEAVNVQTNKNVKNIDRDLFNSRFTYGEEEVYRSNFKEISAQLLTMEFMIELSNMFGKDDIDYVYYETQFTLLKIMDEIITNDMYLNGTNESHYNNLTIKQIFNIALKNNYENKNVAFNEFEAEETYTYEIINRTIPKVFLNANYHDLRIGTLGFRNLNLEEELLKLETYLEHYKAGDYQSLIPSEINTDFMVRGEFAGYAREALAIQTLKVASVLRYGQKPITNEQKNTAIDLISDNLNLFPNTQIQYYRLNTVEELRTRETTTSSETYDELTR